jgi:hypothetical protein
VLNKPDPNLHRSAIGTEAELGCSALAEKVI